MWAHNYNSEQDNPYREPPFLQILYLSYSDNLPHWGYVYHKHEKAYEIVFVVEGCGTLNASNNAHSLQAGDICIVPPGILHYYTSRKPDLMKYYALQLSDSDTGDADFARFLESVRQEPAIIRAANYLDYIQKTFQILCEIHLTNGGIMDDTSQAICFGLLKLTSRLFRQRSMTLPAGPDFYAADIMLYLNQHSPEKITLESLAEHFHLSPSYLSKLFRRTYQVSPITFLIQCRIIAATECLLKSDLSVTEISRMVGYENVTHFSHLFEDRIGCTPGEFRSRSKKPPV